MGDESHPQVSRRQTIDQRIAAIHTRLQQLQELRRGASGRAASTHVERLEAAHRRAAAAQAGAQRALAASALAFRNAAEAHTQAANEHAKAAASGGDNRDEHLRKEAFHRAAAIADQQRAEHAESLLSMTEPAAPSGPGRTVANTAANGVNGADAERRAQNSVPGDRQAWTTLDSAPTPTE